MTIEGALKTLEMEKEIAVKKIKETKEISMDKYLEECCSMKLIGKPIKQRKLMEFALREIDINYIYIIDCLRKLKNFDISNDFKIGEECNDDYISIMRHVIYYLFQLKNIPTRLMNKSYFPSSDYFNIEREKFLK